MNFSLKRCTRCILTETMPFIKFDKDSVCNYCHNYNKSSVKGQEALEKVVDKYRSRTGEPDCIVAFSGGRDSSYGLHYVKKVLGMNPIAYTYDWGMVTALALRNQKRVCGKLGVKHVVISADIKTKRENIRKNIEAWLKRPDVGMIPLFIAGDKQLFCHANHLRKETGIKLIIFNENKLEKTDFKIGFCGIDNVRYTNKRPHAVYFTPFISKIKLIQYYAGQFIMNPSYLNTSLIDSLTAYCSAYFLAHDYLLFYEYIKWDEKKILATLKKEYDWELADDTKVSWRIGDGTAPFYNYLYYRLVGFTENDTFRSNQIREGVLTREGALKIVKEENRPRYESIRRYLETVGLDYDRVMKRIDEISRFDFTNEKEGRA